MPKNSPPWTTLPLRLQPGDDLRRTLETALQAQGATAAFVLAGAGNLRTAVLHVDGAEQATRADGDLELLGLTGSIAPRGAHLHLRAAAPDGQVWAGQVAYGCTVSHTAEVLVALLPGWHFARGAQASTAVAERVLQEHTG